MFLSSFCVGDDIPGHRILVVLKAEEKKKNSKLAKPTATILCIFKTTDMKAFIQPYLLNSYCLLRSILNTGDKNGKQDNYAPCHHGTYRTKEKSNKENNYKSYAM